MFKSYSLCGLLFLSLFFSSCGGDSATRLLVDCREIPANTRRIGFVVELLPSGARSLEAAVIRSTQSAEISLQSISLRMPDGMSGTARLHATSYDSAGNTLATAMSEVFTISAQRDISLRICFGTCANLNDGGAADSGATAPDGGEQWQRCTLGPFRRQFVGTEYMNGSEYHATAIAVSPTGALAASYSLGGKLFHAYRPAGSQTWTDSTVSQLSGLTIGAATGVAFSDYENHWIAYRNPTSNQPGLVYINRALGNKTLISPSQFTSEGSPLALVTDPKAPNEIWIGYTNGFNGSVRIGHGTVGAAFIEIESTTNILNLPRSIALAVDATKALHVATVDGLSHRIFVGKATAADTLMPMQVAGIGASHNVQYQVALALDDRGRNTIAWRTWDHEIKIATETVAGSNSYPAATVVATDPAISGGPVLGVDPDGTQHIAYLNGAKLYYGHRASGGNFAFNSVTESATLADLSMAIGARGQVYLLYAIAEQKALILAEIPCQ